jgi:hypothetical protein
MFAFYSLSYGALRLRPLMALAANIEKLKMKFPRSEKFIDLEYQKYLADESRNDDGEFLNFLRCDVERRNPPEFRGKGLPRGRRRHRRS